ncbi:acetyl-CoA hydrolase/transferase family protein [Litorilituus sediminis]|uniref:Acetyl-CoA hydrolase/transferase family protein n=1 Tax=Litorilituus sediminis TaxID=718192 RepID=A0A4P6P2J1_9GAMM|nr:acetyl-CoA hydrolase/transferase C-terminal domain-containing protein [Litorilituus sediminis]QBG34878.1 acetyl-CoA hydrolase/transferase family protein [Litorilituus sediminis]
MSVRVCNTALEAVSVIEDNEFIWTHSMAATPRILFSALATHAKTRKNLTLMQLHTERSEALADESLLPHLRHRCYFTSTSTRPLIAQGQADYVPIFLSEVPKLFRSKEQVIDTAIIQVSPPDKHGMCTMGVSVEATNAACQMAKKIIAHINPKMPRTHGDAFISYDRFHSVYWQEDELPQHPKSEPDAITQAIGENVAQLINDGDCLQMGIGAIPDAVLACLKDRKDLGIHTEMFSDGVLELLEAGAITNKLKKVHPGKIVTGFAAGTQKLYDFVDDNPQVAFLDIEYVNDTSIIRRNDNVAAINSALQVDISGQVCADSIGTSIYSGVGGQMDFIRAANLSKGGKAVIALPSTAKRGQLSRIVPTLDSGAGVVTTRAHVHYIVTEYGVANLRGKSLRERAEALIAIAHPDFRAELTEQASKLWNISL